MDRSLPASSVHWILQARILEWVARPSSRGSSWPRNGTCLLRLLNCWWILYPWASGKLQVCVDFSKFKSFLMEVWFKLFPVLWVPLCKFQFSSVQSLSHVWFVVTPWTATRQASLSITNSWSLLKLGSIESVMPSNHLILCRPLLLPSIFLSIRVFSNESVLHIRWPKYWSFSFSISPSNECAGLTSIRMDRLDLLAVQSTLRSLLQQHTSKVSELSL